VWLNALSEEQRRVLLGLAHNVVVSDGILDPNEEFMLDDFKREMDLHPRTPSDYVELAGIERIFESRRVRTIAMLNLLRLSYVDGALEIEEECLLKEVSRIFGFGEADFQRLDNWVRRLLALEQEAQTLM